MTVLEKAGWRHYGFALNRGVALTIEKEHIF